MSTITKSLEQTIEELRASIAEKNAELAIYEKVLHMERSKGDSPSPVSRTLAKPVAKSGTQNAAASSGDGALVFTGNKTAFISAVLASRGSKGATPKEIGEVFNERKISRSDNLIYNTLSALVKQKKLDRQDGRYYLRATKRAAKKQ